jgi:hypothetical protein
MNGDVRGPTNRGLSRDFNDNDIYFMQTVSDRLVINNKYSGIAILDGGLETVWERRIMERLMIYASYTNGTEILLDCNESCCFVHLDVKAFTYRVIPLLPELYETSFLPMCEWAENAVFLLCEDGSTGIRVDLSNGGINLIAGCERLEPFSAIHESWKKLKAGGALVHKNYHDRRLALVELGGSFESVSYNDWSREPFEVADAPFHDLEASGGYVAQIDVNGIVLTDGNGCLRLAPKPDGYYFCRGRFLSVDGGTAFFTLASNNANSKECRISRHMLSPGMFTSDGRGA